MLPRSMTPASAEQPFMLDKFLRETVGLNQSQVDSVHQGKAVATVLEFV